MSLSHPFSDHDGGTDTDRLDRWIDAVQRLTPLLVVATLAITVVVLISVNSRNDDDEAAACRSLYANEVNAANANVSKIIGQGLYAVAQNDSALLATVAAQFPDAAKASETALARQRSAIQLNKDDPEAFLEQCRALP